jgi:hypothetical protein
MKVHAMQAAVTIPAMGLRQAGVVSDNTVLHSDLSPGEKHVTSHRRPAAQSK